MNFDLDSLMNSALVLIPLLTGVVQGIKMLMPEKMHKWSPFLAILLGIIFSILTAPAMDGIDYRHAIGVGLVAGLGASGLYSGLKTTMRNGEETID